MSKQCIFCGTQLPDAASFCPSCAKSQTQRETVHGPRLWRKKALIAGAVTLLLLVGALILYEPTPQHLEGVGQVVYQDGKDVYQITVCINPGTPDQPWAATSELSTTLDPSDSFRYPAQLLIYRNGYDPDVQEEFLSKLASCTVSATPLNGGTAMECTLPAANQEFPDAAMVSHITYFATNLRNQITWNFLMHNGDTITLTHIIEAQPLETLHIYPEDQPMNNAEELAALIEKLQQETDTEVIIYLHLPPVTYDRPISLERRAFNLIGSSEGTDRTTFTAGLSVSVNSPSMACMKNIHFSGNGGTGIEAYRGIVVNGCSFTGWDVAILAGDGGSAGVEGCVFSENQIAFKYDTLNYSYFRGDFRNCIFENNGIGFWLARLPGQNILSFPDTAFCQNGVDVQNDTDHKLDLSEAIFE